MTLRARNAHHATVTNPSMQTSSLAVPAGSVYNTANCNGQTVLGFSTDSQGVTGAWGPLPASWTVSLFVRCDRPVNTFGVYTGAGTMTLLACPVVGITVAVPSGGAVPLDATRAGGGPLDGVAAGWPWAGSKWKQMVSTEGAYQVATCYTSPLNSVGFCIPSCSLAVGRGDA
jgi:hypothetical protein